MKHKTYRIGFLTLTFLLGSIIGFAQIAPADISGTYEGMVKRPGAPTEEKISIELKSDAGKITGRAVHGDKTMTATDGKLENGTLTLNFGPDAKFTGKLDGDKLVGEAVHGTNKMPMELKKVTAAAASTTPPASPDVAAGRGAVNLDGQWEAVADANGQPVPFTLTLKIDGENVTGGSSSQMGEATIKSGSWKDGRLTVELEGSGGIVALSATVIEGKLSGEFDYAGQLQGKWVAVKKN